MSLFEELIEDKNEDKKIVNSLKPKSELSSDIFDKDGTYYVMKADVRKKLMEVSNDFIETFGVEFFIHDIILTGSLANYNWSKYSDIDLHIILDMDEFGEEGKDEILIRSIFKEFFEAKKNIWNNKHEVKVKGYDVEVYVQDFQEKHVSSGVYSILHNSWIIEPKLDKPHIDDRKIIEKAEEVANKIDSIVKINNPEKALKAIETYKTKIKKFRQCGLDEGGEYSYENLTFKLLRRNGEIGRLLDFKRDIVNHKLSLNETPDHVIINREELASWKSNDGIPFGIMEGVMMVGFNYKLIPERIQKQIIGHKIENSFIAHYNIKHLFGPNDESVHPHIPPFYEILRRMGLEDKPIDFTSKRTILGFWRTMFKFAGRLWYEKKIISFWEYPENKQELLSILNMLKDKMKKIYQVDIDLNEYSIEILTEKGEIFDDDNIYELIPISKYVGSVEHSEETLNAPHLMSDKEKAENPQMQSTKKRNMERDAELEKKWGSLANRNFLLKKDIAEMLAKK